VRVVHLFASLRPSGMERMLVSAAPHFASAGIDSVIVGQGEDHPYSDELTAAGYRVRLVPRIKSIHGYRSWVRLLREEEPNAVHIHPEQAFALSVLGAKAAIPDTRIIRTFHNLFFAEGWWAVKRRAQAVSVDRYVDAFVALAGVEPALRIADAVERNALGARLSRVEGVR
jgi:glycogen synthase